MSTVYTENYNEYNTFLSKFFIADEVYKQLKRFVNEYESFTSMT